MKEENNISDVELSLISAISSLDNKLEELDHNISLLAKSSKDASSVFDEKEMSNKIKDLENKISDLSVKVNNENKGKTNQKYLNTTPSNKGRSLNQKKGYAIAENLRLKRIDAIEKSLNDLINRFDIYNASNLDNTMTAPSDQIVNTNQSHSSTEEFYMRSKGIFFGFLFSIILVFLLINYLYYLIYNNK